MGGKKGGTSYRLISALKNAAKTLKRWVRDSQQVWDQVFALVRPPPKGSGIVKEMFSKAGELQGWAVSIKTQEDSAGGQGWFWYEVTSTKDPNALAAHGNGVPLCFGCHAASRNDFVLTGYPLQ